MAKVIRNSFGEKEKFVQKTERFFFFFTFAINLSTVLWYSAFFLNGVISTPLILLALLLCMQIGTYQLFLGSGTIMVERFHRNKFVIIIYKPNRIWASFQLDIQQLFFRWGAKSGILLGSVWVFDHCDPLGFSKKNSGVGFCLDFQIDFFWLRTKSQWLQGSVWMTI